MTVEDLSKNGRIVLRYGRFFRELKPPRGAQQPTGFEELAPVNGKLNAGSDGFVYFLGDPFPPGGEGRYRIGEVAVSDGIRLYPGVILDTIGNGQRRFRISYRYLSQYRQSVTS